MRANAWRSLVVAAGITVSILQPIVAGAQSVIQSGDTLEVVGDSITEQKDYSANIEAYLMMCRPVQPVRMAQLGWGGDSMEFFYFRKAMPSILALKPTVITTSFGMNDGHYKALEPKTISDYRDGLTRMVKEYKQGGVRTIIVGSAGAVDPATFRGKPVDALEYNKTLAALGDVARQVAQENGCLFADVHGIMSDVMARAKAKYGDAYHLAGDDGIHPYHNGHLVMAYAYLKAMGFDGNIGTITFDMGSGTATASAGHKVLGVHDGIVEIESSRYPFCFYGDTLSDPHSTKGVVDLIPFSEQLNRFRLVVTNASAPKVRVTWGTASKEFASADLANGINLAAEFMDNPFSEPFRKNLEKIREKQGFETLLYKTHMGNLPWLYLGLGNDDQAKDALTRFDEQMKRHERELMEKTSEVAPVSYTIKVEPVK